MSNLVVRKKRMTTFIKAKLKKSDDQTNKELLQISQNIKINLPKNYHSKIHDDRAIIS